MINSLLCTRIYLRREATDMRKGFDGLAGMVRENFDCDPTDGSLFIFVNRQRNMLKALYWDRDGFALWQKRLERGKFIFSGKGEVLIDRAELALILEGVSVRIIKRSPRWQKP